MEKARTQPSVRVFSDVAKVEQDWRALAERRHASPFLRPEWFNAWFDVFGSGPLRIYACFRDGELVAVAPLHRRHGLWRSPTNAVSPSFDILAADEPAATALIGRMLHDRSALLLHRLLAEGVAVPAFRLVARARNWHLEQRSLHASPYVPTAGRSWPAYEHSLSRNLRKSLRRSRRRLNEAGAVSFELVDPARLEQGLDDAFAVEAASWKHAQHKSVVSDPVMLRFHRDFARRACERGWLRLWLLRLDGRAIAMELAYECGESVYSHLAAYDDAFGEFSPGSLLQSHVLERTFASGLRSYEMLGWADAYKLRWTDVRHPLEELTAFAPSVGGRAARRAYGWAQALRQRRAGRDLTRNGA